MEIKRLSLKSLLHRSKEQARNWRRSFGLIWKASPTYTVYWAILLSLQGVLPGLLVYLTKLVVDNVVIALNSNGQWELVRPAIYFVTLFGLVMLLGDVTKSLLELVRAAQADIFQDYLKNLIHNKSAVVDMADYESHEYHDHLEQATSDASRPLSLLESIGGLVQNTITIIIVSALLLQYSVWLPFVLFISTLPIFLIVIRYDREYHEWWQKTTSKRRWIHYFDTMLTHNAAAVEVRMFDLNPHFQNAYQGLRKDLRGERLAQMRRLGIAKLFASLLSLFVLALVVVWMAWRAVYGVLTLGDLALFYQAFNNGQGLVRNMLGSLGKIIKDSLFLTVLFEFLDLKSSISDPKIPVPAPKNLTHGIRIRDLTFSYPGSDEPVFRNFSLLIPAGKVVALVGENGVGKTTLIKLICRFYDPQSGSIEFDGVDIRRFSVKEHLRSITTIFQMPLKFQATARDSIALGDVSTQSNTDEVEDAARSAGAHDFISRLPDKYGTLLGKMHLKGAELSGGEWQRLALARAYFRKAPVVLLDEPTSFMDSWAESDWFQRFRDLIKDQTGVVITHRFTIAMRADLILVMDKGRIVEQGTHQELIELNGTYAKSWNEQMRVVAESSNGKGNSEKPSSLLIEDGSF